VPANCTLVVEGDCTLRTAIQAANASAGDATITLPDANMVPNNPSSSHIYALDNTNGEVVFNDSGHTITLNGPGASLGIVQMQGTVTNRVMNVFSLTTADISGITVEDGNMTGIGGGVLNSGTLNLSNSTVTANTATSGGGDYLDAGTATLTNDTIDANTATSDRGGLYVNHGTNTVTGGSVSNNTADLDGGGIFFVNNTVGDVANVSGVTVDSNTST
jgi:hypothetical protein